MQRRRTLQARVDDDMRSLGKRRVVLALLVLVILVNYSTRLYTIDLHPTGGIVVWLAHAFVATVTPLVVGMMIEQNMRQKREGKRQ